MADDDTMGTSDLTHARATLVEAIEGAGIAPEANDGQSPDLVKVGSGGLSFELVLNGKTIPLDGEDVNVLSRDAFEDFLARQRVAIENGEHDAEIEAALSADGPGKATARVRSVGEQPG